MYEHQPLLSFELRIRKNAGCLSFYVGKTGTLHCTGNPPPLAGLARSRDAQPQKRVNTFLQSLLIKKKRKKKKRIVYFIHMTLTHSNLYYMTHALNMYTSDKHINESSFDRKIYFKAWISLTELFHATDN